MKHLTFVAIAFASVPIFPVVVIMNLPLHIFYRLVLAALFLGLYGMGFYLLLKRRKL